MKYDCTQNFLHGFFLFLHLLMDCVIVAMCTVQLENSITECEFTV